ncbi:MAG: hypothetical protein CENE_02326 [Candidatus Celerinatantimonas neptuna]|nr:MAG: hypothetical protein CENE_02326 [Candidatus Celerinatantimonas neptuna]
MDDLILSANSDASVKVKMPIALAVKHGLAINRPL